MGLKTAALWQLISRDPADRDATSLMFRTFAKDTHETASIAALIGGTTTYIEMCCPSRIDDALEGYHLWKSKAEGNSACDYTFHMSVTKFEDQTEGQLREIVADGIASFKIFLAYKNFFGVDDGEMYQTFALAKKLGVIVTAHCENAELVGRLQQLLLAEGKTGPEWHEPSRPESVEAEGTNRFATFLETPAPRVTSCIFPASRRLQRRRGREVARRQDLGRIRDAAFPARQNLRGAARSRGNEARHVASAARQAQSDTSCGTRWPRLHRYGRHRSLPLRHVAEAAGHGCLHPNPQRHSGHRGARKSAVYLRRQARHARTSTVLSMPPAPAPPNCSACFRAKAPSPSGSDADLVIYDPDYRGTISAATQHTNCDYNGFEGIDIEGRPSVVTVRGKVQVRDGKFVGERGRGQLLKREPHTSEPRPCMPSDPKRTVAELKELRALTADENGAQRVAWTDTWLKAREWFTSKLAGLPVEASLRRRRQRWITLAGSFGESACCSAAISIPCPTAAGWTAASA